MKKFEILQMCYMYPILRNLSDPYRIQLLLEKMPCHLMFTYCLCLQRFSLRIQLKEFPFIHCGKLSHAAETHHNINSLLQPNENILFDIRNSVFVTYVTDHRGALLIAQHT